MENPDREMSIFLALIKREKAICLLDREKSKEIFRRIMERLGHC